MFVQGFPIRFSLTASSTFFLSSRAFKYLFSIAYSFVSIDLYCRTAPGDASDEAHPVEV